MNIKDFSEVQFISKSKLSMLQVPLDSTKIHEIDTTCCLSYSQKYARAVTSIFYYTCFIPFRFKLDWSLESGPKWRVKQNIFQKAVCICFHTILLFGTIPMLHATFTTSDGRIKPNSILHALLSILGAILSWYFVFSMWFHRDKKFYVILEFNHLFRERATPPNFEELSQNILSVIFPIVSVASTAYLAVHNAFVEHWIESWNLKTVGSISYTFMVVCGNVPDIIHQGVGLCFRDRAATFIRLIENLPSSRISAEFVLREYSNLEHFVDRLNDKFGIWTMMSSVLTIPFYSQKFVELFKGSVTIWIGLLNISFFCGMFFFLMMSAGVSHKICEAMKEWLIERKNFIHLSSAELTILTGKLTPYAIGLKGKNFFTVTYPFVGTIISLIITYAFIDQNNYASVSQFRQH